MDLAKINAEIAENETNKSNLQELLRDIQAMSAKIEACIQLNDVNIKRLEYERLIRAPIDYSIEKNAIKLVRNTTCRDIDVLVARIPVFTADILGCRTHHTGENNCCNLSLIGSIKSKVNKMDLLKQVAKKMSVVEMTKIISNHNMSFATVIVNYCVEPQYAQDMVEIISMLDSSIVAWIKKQLSNKDTIVDEVIARALGAKYNVFAKIFA